MNKTLAWTAALSFCVAVICLSLGGSFAGNDWRGGKHRWWRFAQAGCEAAGDGAKSGSITLPWPAADELTVALPAAVTYQPGSPSQAVVSGDPAIISHLRLADGVLGFDRDFDCWTAGRINVQLTGGPVADWKLSGSPTLALDGISQDAIRIGISGSGDVGATGSVRELSLRISGAGSANLGKLSAKTATVHISGSGDADIAPQDEADIHISGSGTLRVHGRPKIQSHISGSGRIEEVP